MRRRHHNLILGLLLLLLLLPAAAAAQDGLRSASLPERTPANPIPQTQQMLPSASLPDRSPTNPIPGPREDQFRAGPDTYTNKPGRPKPPIFGYGYAGYYYDVAGQPERRAPLEKGYLHLQVQPATAQVYVDGFYAGTVDDFRRVVPGRALDAGPHRIELTAPGYESITFEVLIAPGETIAYRRDLQPTDRGAQPGVTPAPPPPAKAKTFYVIPGCYAGDKPPGGRRLPAGCDVSKLRTIPPEVAIVARR